MGFEDYYERYSRREEGFFDRDKEKNLGDNKILRLFGFAYKEFSKSSYRQTTTTEDVFGTVYSTRTKDITTYAESYTRVKPSANPALEDAFAELYFQKYKTIWDSPYIAGSEKAFFTENQHTQYNKNGFYKKSKYAIILAFLVIAFFDNSPGSFIFLAVAFIIRSIWASIAAKRAWKQGKVSEERKEQNRQAWFAEMAKVYGPEMGAILKKMAIEANYDLETISQQ